MNHHRRFWDELLAALEESLAAFSGVNPDLIDAPAVIPSTCLRDSSRIGFSVQTSAQCTRRRKSGNTIQTINNGR